MGACTADFNTQKTDSQAADKSRQIKKQGAGTKKQLMHFKTEAGNVIGQINNKDQEEAEFMQVLSGCDSSNNDNNEETASEASSNMRNL